MLRQLLDPWAVFKFPTNLAPVLAPQPRRTHVESQRHALTSPHLALIFLAGFPREQIRRSEYESKRQNNCLTVENRTRQVCWDSHMIMIWYEVEIICWINLADAWRIWRKKLSCDLIKQEFIFRASKLSMIQQHTHTQWLFSKEVDQLEMSKIQGSPFLVKWQHILLFMSPSSKCLIYMLLVQTSPRSAP